MKLNKPAKVSEEDPEAREGTKDGKKEEDQEAREEETHPEEDLEEGSQADIEMCSLVKLKE